MRRTALLLFAISVGIVPSQVLSEPGQPQGSKRISPRETRITLSVQDKLIHEVLEQIAAQAGLGLEVDLESLKSTDWDPLRLVTIDLHEAPFPEAVADVCEFPEFISKGACSVILDGKLVVMSIAELSRRFRERAAAVPVPEWMKQPDWGYGYTVEEDGSLAVSIHRTDRVAEEFAQIDTLPRVTKLTLDLAAVIPDEALPVLSRLHDLRRLELSNAMPPDFREGRADQVLELVKALPNLREVSLSQTGATRVGIRHLGANRNLESLSISHDGGLDDAAIQEIATWQHLNSLSLTQYVFLKHLPRMAYSADALSKLSELTNLRHLSLIGFDVPPEVVASPGLLSLGLSGDAINDATAERIAQCRGLQTLNLSRTQIGDAGLRLIAEGTALERLLLSENPRITEVGLSHLKSLPLEFLELRKMRLSDPSFQHLSQIPTLRRIDIWGGPAVPPLPTIEGMRVFKDLPRLRTLWIANFPGNENYAALADLKQLRELTFEMALTSRSDLEVLRRALPKTRIMAGTGGGWVRSGLGNGLGP